MAYSFGGGVRPELGRTDYSGYLQGALQGARSNAAGSAAIGQGIANLGAQVGQGLKDYYSKKEERDKSSRANAFVSELVKKNPAFIRQTFGQDIDPEDKGAVKTIVENFGVANVLKLREEFTKAEDQKTKNSRIAGILGLLESGNGSLEGSGFKPSDLDQQALQQAKSIYAQNEFMQERIGATKRSNRPQPTSPSDKDVLYRDLMAKAIADNGGNPLTPDQRAKISEQAYGSRPPKYVLTVDEQLDLDSKRLENAEVIKRSAAFLDDVSNNAIEASQNLNDIRETRRLLSLPNTNTGWGQEAITFLRSLAARLGMDDAGLAEQEALEAYINVDALRQTQALMSKQGSITENERKLVARTAQTASKNPKALGELLDLREAVAKRSSGAEMERQRLFDEGKSTVQIAEGVRRWYQKNTVSKMLDGIKDLKTSSIVRDANKAMEGGL